MADEMIGVKEEWREGAGLDEEGLKRLREEARKDKEGYWARLARDELEWMKPFSKVMEYDAAEGGGEVKIKWFEDGELNACVNCVDRHVKERGDKAAIVWEGDEGEKETLTYKELLERVCRWGNVLRKYGVGKGDRVAIYMPMISDAACAMLACARVGAVHSVVFGGFSPESLAGRVADCGAKLVITAGVGRRGGKGIPLKANVDAALEIKEAARCVEAVLVARGGGEGEDGVLMKEGRDVWVEEELARASRECEAERMGAEDPLFILYTSGSTGKPKGILHTTGGYLLYTKTTHKMVFDLREDDVHWCTADVGWITGHSYVVYGPLANGATTVMFEGVPNYPDASRFWRVCDALGVTIFYTAPTAIRALMKEGSAPVAATSRGSLRVLGTVGEPINPEAWRWFYEVVGDSRRAVVDTWWQTETGGIMIAPISGATGLKPGSAGEPLPGVEALVVGESGEELEGEGEGRLCLRGTWPGQARTIYGDAARFRETYFSQHPGLYFTGDGCRRDAEGYYWITGRMDDVLNVSGHRIGTAEVESALVAHEKVAEAAVVGAPHEVKGETIYAYVTLNAGEEGSEELRRELVLWVRERIGAFAAPGALQWADDLPKTRSGKIMRRILRKIGSGDTGGGFGDVSTLADPAVVEKLAAGRVEVK